jgi:hypothetical protein
MPALRTSAIPIHSKIKFRELFSQKNTFVIMFASQA